MGTTRSLFAGLVCGLLVAGCSGDPEPIYAEPSDPPSSSVVPSVEPSSEPPSVPPTEAVEPPALPAAAEAPTRSGAEAFARHYVDTLNWVQTAGDTGPLRRLAAAGCDSCRAGVDGLDDLFARGGRYEGGVTTVASTTSTELSVEGNGEQELIDVELTGRVTRSREILPGQDPTIYGAGPVSLRMIVTRDTVGPWRVSLLEFTS